MVHVCASYILDPAAFRDIDMQTGFPQTVTITIQYGYIHIHTSATVTA